MGKSSRLPKPPTVTAAGVSCSPPPLPNRVKINKRVALKEKEKDKRAPSARGEWSEEESPALGREGNEKVEGRVAN